MARADGIDGVDLTDGTYTVRQSLVRDHYRVYDGDGTLVLEAARRERRPRERFRFQDTDGNPVFSIREGNIDGDFFVVPPDADSPLIILERNPALLESEWNVRHGTNERLLATIESREPVLEFFRSYVPLMGVLPHTYTIEDADGSELGRLSGQLTLSDTYELDVAAVDGTDRESLVAAALSIDALEVS